MKSILGVAALVMLMAACSSSGTAATTTPPGASAESLATGISSPPPTTGVVKANGTEPQNPLIPTNTNEEGGLGIIDLIFAGLVYYDATGAPQNDVAESITTTDSQNYDIKIKPGWTFTNGEAVTARSFVDAWNYGALSTNAQLNSLFFEPIQGYSEVSAATPTAQTMSGLVVVSDSEFTVKLSLPQSDFALRLGYTAFYPLPAAAFTDIAAFGETPIGNGPYKVADWAHNVKMDLVPNQDYAGGRRPQNGGITLTFYVGLDAAYADLLSDNIDVMNGIPASSLTSFESDLGERAINQAAAIFISFTIPARLPHFSGDEGTLRRHAVSMAIDRAEIAKVIFNGSQTPATDFTSPVVHGHSDNLKGADVLALDVEQAKALWAQADAISPWSGQLAIAYNADFGNKEWVDALSNSIKNALGIDAVGRPYATFAELRTQITDRTITTAFGSGWQADYPSLYNFLAPLYVTGAGANDGDYSNPAVDTLMSDGAAAPDVEAGIAKFQAAQEILLHDLPAIPLWNTNVVGGYSQQVSNVEFGWNGVPLYYNITKA